jgi:predicted metal-dependent phosphoesterase TrpH
MMNDLPFDKPGQFWKGNLHTHSSYSDGKLPVADVVEAYKRQGYDFLAVTDHFMDRFGYPICDTCTFRSGDFTTIIGSELHAPSLSHGERWHLLAVGLPFEFPPPSEDEDGPGIARRAAEAGAFLAIAHPNWYSLSLKDALTIEHAHAIEVYNHTAHHHNDRGDSWHLADQMLMAGRRLSAIATDDAHFSGRPDFFGGWVHVKSESLQPDALLEALKQGHFYASQGPQIHDISVSDQELTVVSSPARAIFLTGPGSKSRHMRADRLMTATFPLEQFQGSYCRVTVVDDYGRRAWSNPIWLDEES